MASVIQDELLKMGYKAKLVTLKSKPPESFPRAASGSGFFVSSDGILITNLHVVKDAESITISTADGREVGAKIIAIDSQNDLASTKPKQPLNTKKWLPIGSFRKSKIGDDIRIIDYPLVDILGNHPRVTEGIVSSDVGIMNNPTRFQVSASIQPGNSCGPIITHYLSVIGIATETLQTVQQLKPLGQFHKKQSIAGKNNAHSAPPYPHEFRLKVARLYVEDGYPAKQIASQYCISNYSVYRWGQNCQLSAREFE